MSRLPGGVNSAGGQVSGMSWSGQSLRHAGWQRHVRQQSIKMSRSVSSDGNICIYNYFQDGFPLRSSGPERPPGCARRRAAAEGPEPSASLAGAPPPSDGAGWVGHPWRRCWALYGRDRLWQRSPPSSQSLRALRRALRFSPSPRRLPSRASGRRIDVRTSRTTALPSGQRIARRDAPGRDIVRRSGCKGSSERARLARSRI